MHMSRNAAQLLLCVLLTSSLGQHAAAQKAPVVSTSQATDATMQSIGDSIAALSKTVGELAQGQSARADTTRATLVAEAWRLDDDEDDGDRENRTSTIAGIGDIVVVRVENLKRLLDRAECVDATGKRDPNCRKQPIVLYLDGRAITNLYPESHTLDGEDGTVQFHLQRNAENDEAWADLLGAPPLGDGFMLRRTEISIGLEEGYPEETLVTRTGSDKTQVFQLRRIRLEWFVVGSILLLTLAVLMVWLARKSDILRDPGLPPVGAMPTIGMKMSDRFRNARTSRDALKPYSLARCQMAFWFFLVIASFMYIWAITGAYDIITASTLGLIGIGAGTALGAAAIDSGKSQGASTAMPVSKGFLSDVLSDASGISFHRFQLLIWTLALGVLFVYSVWKRLAMPEFPATLLALQGISAGTYLGFKIPEKH